jgi:predicted dehydrogenase
VKSDLDEMLADPGLDAVLIATPDVAHAAQALRAVRSGRHVFCEKPLVTSLVDGIELWDAAWQAGVVLAAGYQLRGHPAHRRAAELCHRGELGRMHHLSARWTYRTADPANWRSTSSGSRWWALSAFGTHLLDLTRWLLGQSCGEVVRIQHFRSSGTWHSQNDETTISACEFASGATAALVASVGFESRGVLEVIGDGGTLRCEGTLGQRGGGRAWLNDTELSVPTADMYAWELDDFVGAIREGRQPEVDVVEAVRNIQLMDATS